MSELTPKHVLVDLFGSGDFPAEIIDPAHAADVVIQRLLDAGFEIIPARSAAISLSGPPRFDPRAPAVTRSAPGSFRRNALAYRAGLACCDHRQQLTHHRHL